MRKSVRMIQKLVPGCEWWPMPMDRCGNISLRRSCMDFINGEIDVLVSTTIIETGLDISNANTMIIHDADRLGLSQLVSAPWTCGTIQPYGICVLNVPEK